MGLKPMREGVIQICQNCSGKGTIRPYISDQGKFNSLIKEIACPKCKGSGRIIATTTTKPFKIPMTKGGKK